MQETGQKCQNSHCAKGIKAVALVAAVLGLVSIHYWQRNLIDLLQAENSRLLDSAKDKQSRQVSQFRQARHELEISRQQAADVHRLRNSVAQLSQDKRALEEQLHTVRKMTAHARGRGLEQGEIVESGEPLDMAIRGVGFFEVQMADGTFGFTRNGRFKLDSQGRIITPGGLDILGGLQPVPPGTTEIIFAPNGEVTMGSPAGSASHRLQLTRFPNPAGLEFIGNGLYHPTGASGPPETGNPSENGFGEIIHKHFEKLD